VQKLVLAAALSVVVLTLAFGTTPVLRAKDEKLKPEQVIARHLESIGSPEKLKEIKTRSILGSGSADFRVGGYGRLNGDATLVSDGPSIRLALKLPALDYPGEQFVFDGKDVVIGQTSPGMRSPLGTFLFHNEGLIKEGLLFGSLTTSWTLLNTGGRPLKLEVNGPKKVEGKSVYELKYVPKKEREVTVFFYFDSESFRHVRTQFKSEVVPTGTFGQGIRDNSETIKYSLTETFDDFKQIDGLTLPHAYKVDYSVDTPGGGFVGSWTYAFTQIVHNKPIDRQMFSVK
jgi:hypothetical protein